MNSCLQCKLRVAPDNKVAICDLKKDSMRQNMVDLFMNAFCSFS
jgi:hypothetical protein